MHETTTETVGFRLSPQQEHHLPASGAAAALVQCAVLLDGPVDVAQMRDALAGVVARHEILRTTFAQPAGMRAPRQVIADPDAASPQERGPAPTGGVALEEEPGVTPTGETVELEELLAREAARPLDLAGGPLVRALVVGAGEHAPLLLLTAHAACADAASLLLIVEEMCALHRGAPLAEEPIQYADYAEWRHELIAGDDPEAEEGLAFWREDAAARPRPPRVLFATRSGPASLPRATAPLALEEIARAQLERAAAAAGASVETLLEAAWHALLARVSGASELLVAGSGEGRGQPDLSHAVGAYEQPVPIRSRIEHATTFAEVIDQVHRARVTALRWQDYATGEDLGELSEQALAGWAFHSLRDQAEPARRVLALHGADGATRLALALRDDGSALAGEISYLPEAVTQADAHEFATRYAILLQSALADPAQTVAQLAILDEAEHRRLLSSAGPPPAEGSQTPIHERFAEQAQLTPDRPAVRAAGGSLSYAELDAAANRLAAHLASVGEVRGGRVGLCMERTPSMLVALIAILKAGGAYVPLNPEHPPARLAGQLRDAGAGVLICEAHLLDRLATLGATVVCVDRDAEAIAACPAERPPSLAAGEDLAYVMYTSGSTGTPKGVGVTHANLSNYVAAISERLSVEDAAEALVFGVVSAISTDLGNTSLFAPLVSGGCVRLIAPEASMDGESLAAELAGEHIDVLKIAPSHLRALLAAQEPGALPRRWLILGGEALSWELVEEVRGLSPGCEILNHYGPTETTVGCTTYAVNEVFREDSLTVPIGFPLAGTRAYVLDRRLEPVPDGVPGELCIAGAGVAAGYLAGAAEGPREGATGFTRDPFAAEQTSSRMYRTGDRVRRLRDGAIEFLGRLDDQLKIRGFRVEPAEIEKALLGHDAIRQAAVCAEDDGSGMLRLIAYVVAPEPPAVEKLRAHLGTTLPDHMIPAAFSTVEALPLTSSGKVDRAALAGIAEVQAQREADFVAPRDEVEQQIAEIWSELLGVERVGALDDFFALGGHSLLATQATMRIRRLYGDIPLRALLAAPTVAALAEVIRTTGAGADRDR